MTVTSAVITLFLLMDPLGNAPIFLSVLGKLENRKRRLAILRELSFALIILMIFLFFGKVILTSLGISTPALSVAGGVVLFLVALRMIFPGRHGGIAGNSDDADPWLVPLAIPLVAGPSSMAFVMLLATQEPGRMTDWLTAVLVAWLIGGAIIFAADFGRRWLKDKGLNLMERLMGMILVVVAVQMLMNGMAQYMATLKDTVP